jgi:hypothetical protein
MENRLAGQSTHLTDEQFTELLLGTQLPVVRAHLDACPQCSKEAAQVSAAIAGFEQQSRLWAERRAASRPAVVTEREPVFGWIGRPQAWTAAALAIALAAGIGVFVRHDRVPAAREAVVSGQPIPATSAPQPTPATLKADNDLLTAIDGELRADESTSASVYGLTTATPMTRAKAPKRISE